MAAAGEAQVPPQAQPKLPPVPSLPALPKGTAPPQAGDRRAQRAGCDAEFHRGAGRAGGDPSSAGRRWRRRRSATRPVWQAEQAKIIAQRGKLSDAQLEVKEKALQDEIAAAQTSFRARDQAIQNSAQAALGAIEIRADRG